MVGIVGVTQRFRPSRGRGDSIVTTAEYGSSLRAVRTGTSGLGPSLAQNSESVGRLL